MVRFLANYIETQVAATEECATISWTYSQELEPLKAYPQWEDALRHELDALGFVVKEIVPKRRSVTCDCAKGPGSFACAAYCSEGPFITLCW